MSLRLWLVLLGFVLVSLVLSCGWVVWALVAGPPGQWMGRIGIPGILQLLELALAYGLLRLSDFAHTWAIRLYLVKAVYAGGLGIGIALGGGFAGVVVPL